MPLERHGDDLGRTIAVLGHVEVRLTGPIGLLVVQAVSVEQDDQVRILLKWSRIRGGLTASDAYRPVVRGPG